MPAKKLAAMCQAPLRVPVQASHSPIAGSPVLALAPRAAESLALCVQLGHPAGRWTEAFRTSRNQEGFCLKPN